MKYSHDQPTYIRRAIYFKLNDFVHLCHFHINKGIQKIGYGMHFSSVGCVKGEQKKTSYVLSLPATPSMNCADEHTWDIEHFLNHTTLWTWLLFFSFYNSRVFCELHIVFVWQFFTHNQLWKKHWRRTGAVCLLEFQDDVQVKECNRLHNTNFT